MPGYNSTKRNNYFHRLEIDRWLKNGWLTNDEHTKLDEALTPYYKNTNLFVGIGLFIFTCIVISAALGFFGLILSEAISSTSAPYFSLIAGVSMLFLHQKVVIDERNQFKTGIDEATLYFALGLVYAALFMWLETQIFNNLLSTSVFFVVFFGLPAFIYWDRLLFALTTVSTIAVIFFLFYEIGGIMLLFIPFALMGTSFGIYTFAKKQMLISSNTMADECWQVVELLSIAVFYLSGNIFIVTELSSELGLQDAFPTPVKWLFYAFTVVMPLLYIYLGLKNKHMAMLNIGLGCIAIAVFSIRYYHQVLAIEYALLLGGTCLIGTAWLAMRFFKNSTTISLNPEDNLNEGLKLESLIIDQTFGKISDKEGFSGDGGKFGGGGATGSF